MLGPYTDRVLMWCCLSTSASFGGSYLYGGAIAKDTLNEISNDFVSFSVL